MSKTLVVRGMYLGHSHVDSYTSDEEGGVYPVFKGDGWVIIRDVKQEFAWWRVEHIIYIGYVGEE